MLHITYGHMLVHDSSFDSRIRLASMRLDHATHGDPPEQTSPEISRASGIARNNSSVFRCPSGRERWRASWPQLQWPGRSTIVSVRCRASSCLEVAKRWWHWKSAAGAEGDALGLDTKRRQDGNDDSNAAGDERKRQAVVAAEIHGDAGLDRRVRRCQQIAELVDEAGKGAAGLVWRQLIEMRGNHAPGALQSARTRL